MPSILVGVSASRPRREGDSLKIEILSDHTQDMIDREKRRQQSTYNRQMQRYQLDSDYWDHLVQGRREAWENSRRLMQQSSPQGWGAYLVRVLASSLVPIIIVVTITGMSMESWIPYFVYAIRALIASFTPLTPPPGITEWTEMWTDIWTWCAMGMNAFSCFLGLAYRFRPAKALEDTINARLGGMPPSDLRSMGLHAPREPEPQGQSQEILRWQAGRDGELSLQHYFSRLLNDDWTLICGYYHRRNEIDQILVGPAGICAIEVKEQSGVVHVDGDDWKRDRYDQHDNLVAEDEPIRDGGGRSPSRQINDAASSLRKYLASCNQPCRVRTAVVLTHESVELGDVSAQTVDSITTLTDLTVGNSGLRDLFSNPLQQLDRQATQRVVDLIRNHHHDSSKQRR